MSIAKEKPYWTCTLTDKSFEALSNADKSFLLTTPNNKFVRMSGTGSSIVAYFYSKKACDNAYEQFKRKFNGVWCIKSKTI